MQGIKNAAKPPINPAIKIPHRELPCWPDAGRDSELPVSPLLIETESAGITGAGNVPAIVSEL